jgi:predicted nucleotidyltransferase
MNEQGRYPDLDRLRSAAHDVARLVGCRLIVLFGSAARSGSREPEDLDLAVLSGRPLDPIELTNVFIAALGLQQVDVVDLRRADPLLMMLVAREGVPVYEETPGEFARFASLAVRRYADTRKFREMERRDVRDRVARNQARP